MEFEVNSIDGKTIDDELYLLIKPTFTKILLLMAKSMNMDLVGLFNLLKAYKNDKRKSKIWCALINETKKELGLTFGLTDNKINTIIENFSNKL